jgi:peptidoglycan/xylan/chitin deacetylase (PgdA/CDA1 family)
MSRRGFVLGGAACLACVWAGLSDVTAGTASAGTRQSTGAPRARTRTKWARHHDQPDAVFQVSTRRPIVALSFDDGPDPDFTPAILDTLAHFGAKATFFVVGTNALAHPGLIRRIHDGGHSFGNHTFDHPALDTLAGTAVRQELERGRKALLEAGTPATALFRPPYGFTNPTVGSVATRAHYTTVFWDACIEHFVNHTTVATGAEHLAHGARPGSIIVGHDGGTIAGTKIGAIDRGRTIEALPTMLRGLHQRGFEVVDVPTLLALRARSAARVTV